MGVSDTSGSNPRGEMRSWQRERDLNMYIRTSEGLGRLPASYLGFGEPAVVLGKFRPKANFVFPKFEFGLSLVPAAHKPAIDALADQIVALAPWVDGPLGTVRLVGH